MKVCCVFSLESPHRGDSNKYTQYTIFNIKKKHTKLSQIYRCGVDSEGLNNEFETAVVSETSVFEPLSEVLLYFRSHSLMWALSITK